MVSGEASGKKNRRTGPIKDDVSLNDPKDPDKRKISAIQIKSGAYAIMRSRHVTVETSLCKLLGSNVRWVRSAECRHTAPDHH